MPIKTLAYDEIEFESPACGPAIGRTDFARHFGLFMERQGGFEIKPTEELLKSGEPFAYMLFWRHYYGYPSSRDEVNAVITGFSWLKESPVLKAVKDGQAVLVIFDWFEGERYDESIVYHYQDKFNALVDLLQVDPKRILFVNGNARLHEEETEHSPRFVYENFWNDSFRYHIPRKFIVHPIKKPYRYLSYARHWNSMRQYFTFELWKKGMLKDGLVSLGLSHAFGIANQGQVSEQHEYFTRTINGIVEGATREEADEFLKMLPLELDVKLEENQAGSLNIQHHLDSELSIVHETDTHFLSVQNKSLFLSEKIYRPLLLGHPFLVMGGTGSLGQLRKEGFRTFHPLIDESYDEESDPIRRKNMVIGELQKYINLPEDERVELHRRLLLIAAFNQYHYASSKRPKFGKNLSEILNVL
jgi:hypothetical protein